ncbi:esterase-like activity of phytase family protein [Sulfitobacter sp. HNIBRBA3233]|uniref:esterase-like activity of phytase family protein n=1 Tax=Sulfitobacter marinivivus TaxID=3158558 RepID=UPI0032DE79DB
MIWRAVAWLALLAQPALAEPALVGERVFDWHDRAAWFGGWSGIEVGDHGTTGVVVSDRGTLAHIKMQRSDGDLTGVEIDRAIPVTGAQGRALPKLQRDLEGIAIGADGRIELSFEHHHRVMRVDPQTGHLSDRRPFFLDLARNVGMEALAIGPDDALYAVAETRPKGDAPLVVHALRGDIWTPAFEIPHRRPFVPVGADFDDRGRLWLLERAATPLGFRSRIRMFTLEGQAAREHILLTTGPGRFDNLEGLSVWRDTKGAIRLTMVSDDNFLWIQRSQIVEFEITQ